MCASRDILDLDMDKARSVLSELGPIKVDDDMMLVSEWGEMELTLYPQGKVMFHPLSEKEKAVEYATEILNKIL